MSDGHRLAQLMRQAGQPSQNTIVDLVVGKVTSVDPLKVKVEDRELTESFLIVGALCKETHIYNLNVEKLEHRHKVPMTTTDPTVCTGSHAHTIQERNTNDNTCAKSVDEHGREHIYHDADFDIMLWRGLEKGDVVWMLKIAQGQKYYIIQREEGVIPDDDPNATSK